MLMRLTLNKFSSKSKMEKKMLSMELKTRKRKKKTMMILTHHSFLSM